MSIAGSNPFSFDRLNHAFDYRPDWDVTTLHDAASKWLESQIDSLTASEFADPQRKICVLRADPGVGKTHLFGRLAHRTEKQILTIFVPQIEVLENPMRHFRWHLIETLFQRRSSNKPSALELGLAKLALDSFRDYFTWLPSSIQAAHHQLGERLKDDPLAVLEITNGVSTTEAFRNLAEAVASDYVPFATVQNDIARALALGWAPERIRTDARKWLRGDTLPDSVREEYRFSDEPIETTKLFRAVSALFGHEVPIVLCCDQLDAVLRSETATKEYTNALTALLHEVPNLQIVLSCLDDRWDQVVAWSETSFGSRCDTPEAGKLEQLDETHIRELLHRRLATWSGTKSSNGDCPFDLDAWAEHYRTDPPSARYLFNQAAGQFQEWLENGQPNVPIRPTKGMDLEDEFQQKWNFELDLIRTDKNRSPDHLQESHIYAIFVEAFNTLRTIDDAQHPPLTSIEEDVLPGTAKSQRFGCMITVDDERSVLGFTKLESARDFSPYLKTFLKTVEKNKAVQGVLVHHDAEPPYGTGKTKDVFEEALQAGTLKSVSLRDYVTDFEQLHCYWSLLRQAEQQNLVCGGKTLEPDDCRQLAVKSAFLDDNNLLAHCLSGAPRPTGSVEQTTSSTEQSNDPPETTRPRRSKGSQSRASNGVDRSDKNGSVATAVAVKKDAQSEVDWANQRLHLVVEQLRTLNVRVEAMEVRKGPVFARLLVRPLGGTTINKVRNRSEDLKIRLELDNLPFIDSQAGAICVDVELPPDQKKTVEFSDVIKHVPKSRRDTPIFPVGQDVAGTTHWADLSNANMCHFLVSGTTGSGKSEFLKSIVASLAHRLAPHELQLILIDPKRVTFNLGGDSPYLHAPVAYTANETIPLLQWAAEETEKRYSQLQKARVSSLAQLQDVTGNAPPRIVVVCDEFADLMASKETKEDLESALKTLSAKARAAGIHLILATQRPEKTVVTPIIKTNLPGRIALKVKSKGDSEIAINRPDACQLLGKGDLLWERAASVLRLQSPLVHSDEFEAVLRVSN
ncbi:DNA translocase SftA [Thalassoglobus neptunius]|uniref:DNA translocase SftA n=1 Tax=Thalassoglobus neptunius TaxID=1938619 RepID=A0A5C5VN19_9PLAN|nr:DNA translocase FtsK [Thalassoglobus neptunius]TWT40056.1 DNA translocase SftA [Thalassoglobus neptunius]